jgi:hypothetical protein
VRAYTARGEIPAPDAYVGATKVWRQETIKEWAARRPRKGASRAHDHLSAHNLYTVRRFRVLLGRRIWPLGGAEFEAASPM